MDRYARLVSRTLEVPTASVTFVQIDRQVNIGAVGLNEETMQTRLVPITHSFCKHVVAGTEPLVVEDARQHPALHDHPGITDDDIIAYAGWPIHDHTGQVLGSLCAIDSRPHRWTARQIAMLRDLAGACSAELTARGQASEARADADVARGRAERDRSLLMLSDTLAAVRDLGQLGETVHAMARSQLGCSTATVWLVDHAHAGLVAIGADGSGADPATATADDAAREAVLSTGVADFVTDGAVGSAGSPGVALLPLPADGQVVGVLELTWDDAGTITDRQRDRAPALARYSGWAVHRIRSGGSGTSSSAASGPAY